MTESLYSQNVDLDARATTAGACAHDFVSCLLILNGVLLSNSLFAFRSLLAEKHPCAHMFMLLVLSSRLPWLSVSERSPFSISTVTCALSDVFHHLHLCQLLWHCAAKKYSTQAKCALGSMV